MTNILLVHGAIADGSSWLRVIPLLQAAGHQVVAVQQPLSSIPDDIAATRRALGKFEGPTVVVGHSFGGVVITEAVAGFSNVKALVYVSAFAPDSGESAGSLGENFPEPPSAPYFIKDEDGLLLLPQDKFQKYFSPGVDPELSRIMAAVQGPSDAARFEYVIEDAGWKRYPTYFVVSGKDQIIAPELEKFCAERMSAETVVIDGAPHASMCSHPNEVARLILLAADR